MAFLGLPEARRVHRSFRRKRRCTMVDYKLTNFNLDSFRFNAHQEPEMTSQINELSVLNNKTVSSLKSIVDSKGIVDVQGSSFGCNQLLELF